MNNFKFNHRIILQRECQTDNGRYSGLDVNFEMIAEVWASIEPLSLKQNFLRVKNDVEISHTITIRYREDAKDCKRIMFKQRIFNVLGTICPDENYDILVFNVKELV